MSWINIKQGCYYYHATVNIGYVTNGSDTGIIIDTGLEPQAIKKVIKVIERENLPITHCFITHAHADHFGGAAYLKNQKNVTIYAPPFEAAIMENPLLEPLYLYHGAKPPKELRNKFVEGAPIKVDVLLSEGTFEIGGISIQCISLPGHSYEQMGFIINGILFAADSYFGKETLVKHKIPYIIDANQTIQTLKKILSLPICGALPGHGTYEENFLETIELNIKTHNNITNDILNLLNTNEEGLSLEAVMECLCAKHEIHLSNLGQWALYRTAITAYINKLIQDDQAMWEVINNRLIVKTKNSSTFE